MTPRRWRPAIGIVLACLTVSLASAGGKVKRKDARGVVSLTTAIESMDLQGIAAGMVASLLVSIDRDQRPVVVMGGLRNRTAEHLDTKSITDKIRTALVQSGRVRFVANDLRDQILAEYAYQRSGRVRPGTRVRSDRGTGATYIMAGEISAIDTRTKRIKDVYYKVTLNLIDLETQIIEWSDEQEIRKQAVRRVFGR